MADSTDSTPSASPPATPKASASATAEPTSCLQQPQQPHPPVEAHTVSSSLPTIPALKPLELKSATRAISAIAEEEDHIAVFKRMLDDILDNASTDTLTHGLEPGKSGPKATLTTSASASHLALSSTTERARLTRSTTLGFLLPQPKTHLEKLKELHSGNRSELTPSSAVDQDLLHKLEEQNNQLPPQESASYLLARLERQSGLLETDPKSVCIESKSLHGNLSTLHRLMAESTSDLHNSNIANQQGELTADLINQEASLELELRAEEIDWEFWGMLVQDYSAVASKLPHLLAARVRRGLPPKLRGLIWQSMSQASSTYLETMYSQLVKESSPYERVIQRDLARTFPQVAMFKDENGEGQKMLSNILKAYSLYDPHVGYCQGLGFLVGPLLMNMKEREAFCVFVRLMETYDMRTMFTLNMEGLQLRLHQFSALLSEHLPMLHTHLAFHSINATMYASQWFLSLFAYTYPLPLVMRIYDVVFSEGAPETIMRVAVAFLKKNEERLMQLQEFEDLLEVLTSKLYDVYEDDAGEVIRDAMLLSTRITKEKLDTLAIAYVAELEDQQQRTGEITSQRFKDRFGKETAAPPPTSAAPKTSVKSKLSRGANRLSIAASFGSSSALLYSANSSGNSESSSEEEDSTAATTPQKSSPVLAEASPSMSSDAMLLEQIKDLAKALSLLQRDHVEVTESLVQNRIEKSQCLEEIDHLRKKVSDMERQQNRFSMMSVVAPSVMSQSDAASSVAMSSPRTATHDEGKIRPGSSWSNHSQEDDDYYDIHKTSSVSSLGITQDDLAHRLAAAERELAHVTSELMGSKVTVMEAMNEAESQRTKAQTLEKILLDSREALIQLQEQQMTLQNNKMTIMMERDNFRHERSEFERRLSHVQKQLEDNMNLLSKERLERQSLKEKVEELEMNAAYAAANAGANLRRGRSVRQSLNEVAMYNMLNRGGSPSPRTSTFMLEETIMPQSPLSEQAFSISRRGSDDSIDSARNSNNNLRRGSTDTQTSSVSGGGRESICSARPTATVRKGWPSEKAASAGVVPSVPMTNVYGTRKFVVSAESEPAKLKRTASNRNSVFGSLGFRRAETS